VFTTRHSKINFLLFGVNLLGKHPTFSIIIRQNIFKDKTKMGTNQQ